jgi:hypothetical protein
VIILSEKLFIPFIINFTKSSELVSEPSRLVEVDPASLIPDDHRSTPYGKDLNEFIKNGGKLPSSGLTEVKPD